LLKLRRILGRKLEEKCPENSNFGQLGKRGTLGNVYAWLRQSNIARAKGCPFETHIGYALFFLARSSVTPELVNRPKQLFWY
jgi:hypothetical protein